MRMSLSPLAAGGRRRGGRGWHQHPHQQQQQQQGCHWQQGEQEEYWEEQGSWHQQQEQGPWQQEQRRRQQSKRRNLARDQRATLLRLMTEPSFQQTKLGAAFSPARQLHSQLFLHLAARYIGAPLGKVILGGARLRPRPGGWAAAQGAVAASGCRLHLCVQKSLPACGAVHHFG